MRTPFEKAFATYCREVRAVCPAFLRREMLRSLRVRAQHLQAEEPACDAEMLRERLGNPQEVVEEFEHAYYADEERPARERYRCVNVGLIVLLSIMLIISITALAIHIVYESKEARCVHITLDSTEEEKL